ncbi:MAG: response regulator [Archangium sp.]|nr:response regulator [Archangium sp.]
MLDRITAFFYAVKDPAEDQRARAQLMVVAMLAGGLSAATSMLLTLVFRPAPEALEPFAGMTACLLPLLVLRRSHSLEEASEVLAASLTGFYGLWALYTGDPSFLTWVAIVPFTLLLLGRVPMALRWFILNSAIIAAISLFFVAHPARLHLASHPVILSRLAIFLVAIFALTLIFALSRERAQRALVATRDEANRANALKSEFLASFSHEIRTPLNGVLGTADGLLAGHLAPDVREQLLIIQRSGSSLLRTINDVLELSRIEAGRLDLFPTPTDLPAMLSEVVDLFKARAAGKGVSIRLALEPQHPCDVKVDDLRLRQVVQNLVGNAVKFTQRGEVVVRLGSGTIADGHVLTRISVEDTGPGIEPEATSRLFTAFTQARPRSDRVEGAGLGLAISKQFVDLMDGELGVESTVGKGTTFRIELVLPLAQHEAVAPVPTAQAAEAQPLKLLVVDDNEINLKVAVTLLGKLGHTCVVARDGEQALAAVAQHQPDVVFMDCHMPVLDGLDATRRLRAAGDGRPVVAITASVYAEDMQRCLAAGMNHFVSKPVTLLALKQALHEVAGLASAPVHLKPVEVREVRRVLVVDDDPHVRRMTVRLLRAAGFEVNDAADIEAAMILFERAAPSHLLVDRVLGGTEDGIHFAERLARLRSGLRVVVTSGQAPTEEQLFSLEATGGRFLAKPYNRRNLISSLTGEAA